MGKIVKMKSGRKIPTAPSSLELEEPLPRTRSEDRRKEVQEDWVWTRPSHKRTVSDSLRPLKPLTLQPATEGLSTDRPGSPSLTDDDMSESELMIRRIIGQRVLPKEVADLVVEERAEEEEDSEEEGRRPVQELGWILMEYAKRKAAQNQTEARRKREVKQRVLSLVGGDDKLSQRQTPQMSMLLSEALRSSSNSTATIPGPGGSFHVQDIFSSDESIPELNPDISIRATALKPPALHSPGDFVVIGDDPSADMSPVRPSPRHYRAAGNIPRVRKALETVCLPGDLFAKQKREVMAVLAKVKESSWVAILLSSGFPKNQYCGLYEEMEVGYRKITGSVFDPVVIPAGEVGAFLMFREDLRDFMETQSGRCDAIRLKD